MSGKNMNPSRRLSNYGTAATELALLSDRFLADLLAKSAQMNKSIGGTTGLIEISGIPVFFKIVRLTDLEGLKENRMSTANVFGLPIFCQYGIGTGIGSPGFGVWRELATHTMTTNWVLAGECQNFPLMYHWRVLPAPTPKPPTSEELKDLENTVEYWEGSMAVRSRLEANLKASANVVLFLEHFPMTLHNWLHDRVSKGGEVAESSIAMVERELERITSFMNSRDLLHFDAHCRNILTDGENLYFADFGLAVSARFELSKEELTFFENHRSYDRCLTLTNLVNCLITSLQEAVDPDTLLSQYATGKRNGTPAPSIASVIKRYAPVAVVMKEFYRKFLTEARTAKYPAFELERVSSSEALC